MKDPIDTLNCWRIYSISCQCGLSYIGQTKHRLIFHLNEHKLNIRNQETMTIYLSFEYFKMFSCIKVIHYFSTSNSLKQIFSIVNVKQQIRSVLWLSWKCIDMKSNWILCFKIDVTAIIFQAVRDRMKLSIKKCHEIKYSLAIVTFYFLLATSRESIVSGSNFWSREFDVFTRFEVNWIRKLHFLRSVCVCVCVSQCLCVCYQYNSKTNYSRNSKFGILHVYHM